MTQSLTDPAELPASAQRVADALARLGIDAEIRLFPEGTRTAEDAARAIGCEVGQIVKSLVFAAGERAILALTSGANRVDLAKLGDACGAEVRRATPDQAREWTGYAIGGIPPVGHAKSLETYVDRALLDYETVWAAAGHPSCVFSISPGELLRATQGRTIDLAES